MAIDFGTMAAGDELANLSFAVSTEEVRAYLDATGESMKRWAQYVPPLAIGALALGELMSLMETLNGVLHTGQQFSFDAAVAHDTEIAARFTVASASRRRGALITAVEIELSSDGKRIGSGRASLMLAPDESEVAQ
ncbi:MAG TPA: hypothetical protein QGI71_00095 [Dehalococcoidia bacterium]|nr:hypothetical protein [Dehalococcoidia bacterium]